MEQLVEENVMILCGFTSNCECVGVWGFGVFGHGYSINK